MSDGHDANYTIRAAPRLFVESDLAGDGLVLGEHDAHYLVNVLRLESGEQVVAFNGRGDERLATVAKVARRSAALQLHDRLAPLPEPALEITLVQAVVKGDAMDLIVQKATELGVRNIYGVKTDFSVVRVDEGRVAQRAGHWRKIARSACEQSGRHFAPAIGLFQSLETCLAQLPPGGARIVLDREAQAGFASLEPPVGRVCVLVGAEGGFSAAELERIHATGFASARLGPRTLRATTAAIAACALAQFHWGDLR